MVRSAAADALPDRVPCGGADREPQRFIGPA